MLVLGVTASLGQVESCGAALSTTDESDAHRRVFLHRNAEETSELYNYYHRPNPQLDEAAYETIAHAAGFILGARSAALFSQDGERLAGSGWIPMDGEHVYAVDAGTGFFVWPAVGIGHTRRLTGPEGHRYQMETLDESPRIFRLRGFLTSDEAAALRTAASRHFETSHSMSTETGDVYPLEDRRRQSQSIRCRRFEPAPCASGRKPCLVALSPHGCTLLSPRSS